MGFPEGPKKDEASGTSMRISRHEKARIEEAQKMVLFGMRRSSRIPFPEGWTEYLAPSLLVSGYHSKGAHSLGRIASLGSDLVCETLRGLHPSYAECALEDPEVMPVVPDESQFPILDVWGLQRSETSFPGSFPAGFLDRFSDLVGVDPEQMLHIFSGGLELPFMVDDEWTSGDPSPFGDGRFPVVLADPPYSQEEALRMYGRRYAGPYSFVPEAVRVCAPGGIVAIISRLVYDLRDGFEGCRPLSNIAVVCGRNLNVRVLCIFQKPLSGDRS